MKYLTNNIFWYGFQIANSKYEPILDAILIFLRKPSPVNLDPQFSSPYKEAISISREKIQTKKAGFSPVRMAVKVQNRQD